MVAYSFAPQFAAQVATGTKCQTVRADRKRHARAGEPVQLYAGMRTRQCRKLIDIDPICLDVRSIRIEIAPILWPIVTKIEIDGDSLNPGAIEAFAAADGFDPEALNDGHSSRRMAEFWRRHHGKAPFAGVVIRWVAAK